MYLEEKTRTGNRAIGIYYEHPDWFRTLFRTLDDRGLSYEKIDASSDYYDPEKCADFLVLFNRMSASAYLRGNSNAIFYTGGLLASLERSGVRVINGSKAFQIEISKALQVSLLASLGVKFPVTRIVNSIAKLIEAAGQLKFPILVKPNIGGRGAGIVKFDSSDELRAAVDGKLIDLGIDGTLIVQEFVNKRDGHINRIETLNGKFLYALKIYSNGENFNLCPAEICQTEIAATSGEICLADGPKAGLRVENFVPPPSIIQTVEEIVAAANIDVGGVEYLIDDSTGEPLFYDINALSNFVADAENVVGFDPNEKLVDFLEEELKLCDTDIGCRSLAAG